MKDYIKIRIDTEDKLKLKEYCFNNSHENISRMFRDVMFDYINQPHPETLKKSLLMLRKEVSSVGNNLNQLTIRHNKGENIDVSECLEQILLLKYQINKQLRKIKPVKRSDSIVL